MTVVCVSVRARIGALNFFVCLSIVFCLEKCKTIVCFCYFCFLSLSPRPDRYTVGYTMRDIRYKWNEGPNSVGVSNEVSLPQFKVLGHRQRAMEISLTTGTASPLVTHHFPYQYKFKCFFLGNTLLGVAFDFQCFFLLH